MTQIIEVKNCEVDGIEMSTHAKCVLCGILFGDKHSSENIGGKCDWCSKGFKLSQTCVECNTPIKNTMDTFLHTGNFCQKCYAELGKEKDE